MIAQLLQAVQDNEYWRRNFTRLTYETTFKAYCDRYAALFQMAVQRAESPERLAKELLDGLEAGWKKQRIWNRGRIRAEEKSMIVTYFNPMLLSTGDASCREMAYALKEFWGQHWKGDVYEVADYDTLKSGFKNRIFGIEIDKHKR